MSLHLRSLCVTVYLWKRKLQCDWKKENFSMLQRNVFFHCCMQHSKTLGKSWKYFQENQREERRRRKVENGYHNSCNRFFSIFFLNFSSSYLRHGMKRDYFRTHTLHTISCQQVKNSSSFSSPQANAHTYILNIISKGITTIKFFASLLLFLLFSSHYTR